MKKTAQRQAKKFVVSDAAKRAAKSPSMTVSVPAGDAGTVKDFQIPVFPIINSAGSAIGSYDDTSLVLSAGVFDNEVAFGTPDEEMANGDYFVDYYTGEGRGKKKTSGTSETAVCKYFVAPGGIGKTVFARGFQVGTLQAVAAAAKLVSVRIRNGSTGQYFQVHNDADGAGLSNSTKKEEIYLDANESGSIDLRTPEDYSAGIFVGSSTVATGYTAGATDNTIVVEYEPI